MSEQLHVAGCPRLLAEPEFAPEAEPERASTDYHPNQGSLFALEVEHGPGFGTHPCAARRRRESQLEFGFAGISARKLEQKVQCVPLRHRQEWTDHDERVRYEVDARSVTQVELAQWEVVKTWGFFGAAWEDGLPLVPRPCRPLLAIVCEAYARGHFGVVATQPELAAALGVTDRTIRNWLVVLRERGLVRTLQLWKKGESRKQPRDHHTLLVRPGGAVEPFLRSLVDAKRADDSDGFRAPVQRGERGRARATAARVRRTSREAFKGRVADVYEQRRRWEEAGDRRRASGAPPRCQGGRSRRGPGQPSMPQGVGARVRPSVAGRRPAAEREAFPRSGTDWPARPVGPTGPVGSSAESPTPPQETLARREQLPGNKFQCSRPLPPTGVGDSAEDPTGPVGPTGLAGQSVPLRGNASRSAAGRRPATEGRTRAPTPCQPDPGSRGLALKSEGPDSPTAGPGLAEAIRGGGQAGHELRYRAAVAEAWSALQRPPTDDETRKTIEPATVEPLPLLDDPKLRDMLARARVALVNSDDAP